MRVLGIESSCDETAVAIYETEKGLLYDCLYSQIDLHRAYGGVVPELAARDHAAKCAPMVAQALEDNQIKINEIDGIAYTCGPGLAGALMVGACVGHALAEVLGIPALGVNHLEGHVMAVQLEDSPPAVPFLALLVSGGHTQLIHVAGLGRYETLGESVDDAVGEAFDKTAKLLGLGYPGGAALAALAEDAQQCHLRFPRPMVNRPGLDFSFSGLKTYVANVVQEKGEGGLDDVARAEIAWAFQDAAVDTLVIKCKRALKQTGLERLVMGGGVAANLVLRERLQALSQELDRPMTVYYPQQKYCTDNAAMIAYVGHERLMAGEYSETIDIRPRFPLEDLKPPR